MAREPLGCAAVVEGLLRPVAGGRLVRCEAGLDERGGGERERDLVQAGLAARR